MSLIRLNRVRSGFWIHGKAGENLTNREALYISGDELWSLSDADATATMPVSGICMNTALTGENVRVLLRGTISDAAWAWTPGATLYASTVAGGLTETAPTAPAIVQAVGYAYRATMIYFDPDGIGLGAAAGCPILEGSTAYVGFDECKEPYVNYWYCDGTADEVQINLALAYVTALGGGSVELEQGTYTIVNPITFTGSRLMLIGQGQDTFIDGDGLATTEHAIVIDSRNDCVIRDLSIQTQNGGQNTCHCIFINDSANRTLIQNVTIVDSDDNGIHFEGVSQGTMRVLNCDILGADGHGIYVGMDGENLLYNLQVRDCRFTQIGADGIHLDRAKNAQIFDNAFDTSIGSDGIELVDSDDCHITNNNMSGVTGYDINISAATCDRTKVFNNILYGDGTGCINDAGTDTKLAVAPFQFTEAIVGAIVTTPPTGVDVDANTESALAWGQIPHEVQQVVKLKVWAIATDAPIGTPGNMHVEVIFNAGASNAAYNEAGKSWVAINKDSVEVDYVASDVVHWVLTDADTGDSEISALVAGDSFEIIALHEAGDDPDGATDALFRVVEVEYV